VTPRVSVIVAAHNAAVTLPETLASLRAQTVADWEAVLVDDGSDDETGAVARASDPRVRVLRNDRPAGPARARNRALHEARGELVAVLDADDLYAPTYLERQIAVCDGAIAEGRRVGAVCCDAELLAPDGTRSRWSDRVGRVECVDLATVLAENVVFGLVLGRRAAFLDVGGYYEALGGEEDDEDYDLWVRMLEAGWEIVVNPEVLATYRLGAATRSSQIADTAVAGRDLMARALARGALTPGQRKIARRRRRLFEIVRRRADIEAEPRRWRRVAARARLAPLAAVAVVENPQRWRKWFSHGVRTAGRERHVSV
jgi:glycosyltransferase involved in cell wall biosynthesis